LDPLAGAPDAEEEPVGDPVGDWEVDVVSVGSVCVGVGVGVGDGVGLGFGAACEDDDALVVGAGSATLSPVSPLISAESGSGSFGVPWSTAFMNCCQIWPGSPEP
jgi:hypothetical protein